MTVNGFNRKKLNVDVLNVNVLTEVRKTIGELFPCLDQLGSKGARNKFKLLVKSVAQFSRKKLMPQTGKNLHWQHLMEKCNA